MGICSSGVGFGATLDLGLRAYMDTSKNAIAAVHDDNLAEFLEGLGVLSDVSKGKAKCKFCRQTVTLDNLVAVFPESGDIKFVCDRAECLQNLTEHRAELRGTEPEPASDSKTAS